MVYVLPLPVWPYCDPAGRQARGSGEGLGVIKRHLHAARSHGGGRRSAALGQGGAGPRGSPPICSICHFMRTAKMEELKPWRQFSTASTPATWKTSS